MIDFYSKHVYNAKLNNIGDKIRDIASLATNTTLNAKINVKNLVKKTDYNTKSSETENKTTTDHD